MFNQVPPLTARRAFAAWRLRLVDENTEEWVDFPSRDASAARLEELQAKA